MQRNNNVIGKDGEIGYFEGTVKWQGSRGWMKEVYIDIDEFNEHWKSINKYWAENKPKHGFRRPLTEDEKQTVDELIARLANVREHKYD